MRGSGRLVLVALLAAEFIPGAIAAASPGTETTDVDLSRFPECSGYHPDPRGWGLLDVGPVNPEAWCAPNEAILFHATLIGPDGPPMYTPVRGSCCPLPAGALTDDHLYAIGRCPPDRVITGARIRNLERIREVLARPEYEIRCTRIDGPRYELGEVTPAIRLEYGRRDPMLSRLGLGARSGVTAWNLIPRRIRYGLGRVSEYEWMQSGCLGQPWGALLSEIGGRKCKGFGFRALRERKDPKQDRHE